MTDLLVCEEVVAGELPAVLCALHIASEGSAPPAREEAVVACLRHCRRPRRHRCPLDDDLPTIAGPGSLRAGNATEDRGLCAALGGREEHPISDVGNRIEVRGRCASTSGADHLTSQM